MQTITARVVQIVTERSGGWCEVQLPSCTAEATQMHHRRRKGMGGDRRPGTNEAGNLLHACYHCHDQIERHRRTEARINGWTVHPNLDPTTEPVTYRQEPGRYLHNDGTITEASPDHA